MLLLDNSGFMPGLIPLPGDLVAGLCEPSVDSVHPFFHGLSITSLRPAPCRVEGGFKMGSFGKKAAFDHFPFRSMVGFGRIHLDSVGFPTV